MANTKLNNGRIGYRMQNDRVKLDITALCGHMSAEFSLDGGKTATPYFVAPWWKEEWIDTKLNLLNTFRGTFFCLPMGGDYDSYYGIEQECHGKCANEEWSIIDINEDSGKGEFVCQTDCGKITKRVFLKNDESVVYESNTINGLSGKYPVAYHPMLHMPQNDEGYHLAVGGVIKGITSDTAIEQPINRGYTLFRQNEWFDGMKVPTQMGDYEDVSQQPIRHGYDDVVQLIEDIDADFGYSAVTYIKQGYVYFQLKNPKLLQSTMLWMSMGGRHYSPWNGRCTNVLGIEETTSYFHWGVKRSVEENPISSNGYATYLDISENTCIPIIYGAVSVPDGFKGVKSISRSGEGIEITGLDGEKVFQKLDLNFLDGKE